MQLTPRAVAYLATEEGIALESYLDSADPPNWTWAMGLTASLVDCIRASTARLNAVYMPAINRAFAGHLLNDGQLAAALSFHWSTDAIEHADWANAWKVSKPGHRPVRPVPTDIMPILQQILGGQ